MSGPPAPAPQPHEATGPADLAGLVGRVPVGWTEVAYDGHAWGLTRSDHARGGTTTLFAEQLGGPASVSANVWHTRAGDVLRPCEMPEADVLDFLRGWTADERPASPRRTGSARMGTVEKLSAQEVVDQVPTGWALLVDGLHTRVAVADLGVAADLAQGIAAAALQTGGAPDLALRADAVDVRLTTREVHGVTAADVRLAAAVTRLVEDSGLETSAQGLSRLELALDTPDLDAVADFWAAVLRADRGAAPELDDEVRDPSDALPTVWFQPSGDEEPRQRWHPDVWVDPAEVADRIDAARKAGGDLVSDAEAPAFWVLADPQGNRVCLCTWQGRDRA